MPFNPAPETITAEALAPQRATERQIGFICRLLDEKDVAPKDGKTIADLKQEAATCTKARASNWITKLMSLPNKPAAAPTPKGQNMPAHLADVPAGRYAVGIKGVLGFYHVQTPTEGRWAGYTFVKQQASDDLHPVKGERKYEVLRTIAATGPETASKRYGLELGKCGVCGRTLTDADSRAKGIGPVCADKQGW
jgi:hypothetical protein